MYVNESLERLTEEAIIETSARGVLPGSLMLGMYDTAALKSSISTVRSSCNQAIAFAQIDNTRAETLYVYYAVQLGKDEFRSRQRGVQLTLAALPWNPRKDRMQHRIAPLSGGAHGIQELANFQLETAAVVGK